MSEPVKGIIESVNKWVGLLVKLVVRGRAYVGNPSYFLYTPSRYDVTRAQLGLTERPV
jgi:hypothetical protein